jgi:hypothetical protein
MLAFKQETQMPPIEEYLEQADKLAQDVVNAWGPSAASGHAAEQSPEFKALFDKACLYRTAREIADGRRQLNILSEQDAANEKATRQAFAESYKAVYEKHVEKSNQASA